MRVKHRRLSFIVGLVAFLFAARYFNVGDHVLHVIEAFQYTDALLNSMEPVAIHQNPAGEDTQVVCAIEVSLSSCHGMGFGAMVLQTIDQLTTCLALGFVPTVTWTECDYCGPPGHGQNYWTWYFQALNEGIEQRAKTVICMGPSSSPFGSSVYLTRQGASGKLVATGNLVDFRFADMENKISGYAQPITAETRALASYVISGYLKPAAQVENSVDTFYQSFMADSVNIGVHVRLDQGHVEEMSQLFQQKAPELQDFLLVVKRLIDNNSATNAGKEFRIFLASDTNEVIKVFKAEFGDKRVLNINAFRGQDMLNRVDKRSDGRLLGEQVFTDILLLAKCDYLVHDESSVAAVAYYYNPNIESHYVSGDDSDHRRLNARPRFDSEELFRQAAVRKRHNIFPDWQSAFLERMKMKYIAMWAILTVDETVFQEVTCFYDNLQWSKCREEFERSKFASSDDLSGLVGS